MMEDYEKIRGMVAKYLGYEPRESQPISRAVSLLLRSREEALTELQEVKSELYQVSLQNKRTTLDLAIQKTVASARNHQNEEFSAACLRADKAEFDLADAQDDLGKVLVSLRAILETGSDLLKEVEPGHKAALLQDDLEAARVLLTSLKSRRV